ncbi:hypothetical protein JW711_02190 [Candidatus Woesearchaeota archaeon]|nr:hypothetical protein [Candidatus Woesearchaeota archaeon]
MEMLNSKKGFYMSARDWISFFIGLVLFAVGIIPLLSKFKIIGFGLPGFMSSLMGSIFFWIIAIAGAYIIVDGIIEPAGHMLHTALLIIGFVFVIAGLIPILHSFKVIGFSVPGLDNLVVYNIIIVVEGLMLMSAGFTMR